MDDPSIRALTTRVSKVLAVASLLTTVACGGGGGGGGTGTASDGAASTPTPTPPANSITIDGAVKTPTAIDTLVTRSGHWQFSDLGAVGDSHAYLWRLDETPDFVRVMVCRRTFTLEANDSAAVSVQSVAVNIQDRGHSYSWALKVSQGSCRVMQNMEPVAPHPDWLRDAVATLRIPSYKRERSFLPLTLTLTPDSQRGAYDPSSLGPIPGSTSTPTSDSNFVGVTSTQGGEYESSRGFLHNVDARVVDAALHNEDSLISAFMPEFTQYTFYSLAQPQAAVWSTTNKTTVDPQFPQTGDHPYEINNAPGHPRSDIDTVVLATDWGRDDAHLENTAYVHWILTEDPVAGMAVQRQLAFVLACYFEYERATPQVTYGMPPDQERGIFNGLTALWKSRDVARRVTSTNGTVIWPASRLDRMVSEGIAAIDSEQRTFPGRDIAAITGAVLTQISPFTWATRDGGMITLAGESNFQGFQYGKEPMWLWTKDGNATVANFFKLKTRQAVVRALYIGGAYGVDRSEDTRGSSLPLGPLTTDSSGNMVVGSTPFHTDLEWAAYVLALPLAPQSTTSYDAAAVHTVQQMYEMLQFAKNANLPVPDLDAAIARMDADRGRTTAFGFAGIQEHKHTGGPPG